jgi:type IV pilus assembly protein PilC
MATFAYSGRTRAGESVAGERMAETMEAAVSALRRERILVTKIVPARAKAADAAPKKSGRLGKSVSAKSLAVFTRQFSVMIDAGLPLVQCLDILGSQEDDKNFAAVILATRTSVESGASLADAMRKHPKAFDPLFTNMVAAGEAGGILDTILKRLATYIEKAVKLKGQVKSAMIYPVAVLVIAALVVGVILWKVIPTFASLFEGLGAELPLPTRIVIWMSGAGRLLPVPAGRRRRRHVGVPHVLQDRQRPPRGGPFDVAAAGPGRHSPQDCGGTVLPNARDAGQLRRADSRRPRDHGQDRG